MFVFQFEQIILFVIQLDKLYSLKYWENKSSFNKIIFILFKLIPISEPVQRIPGRTSVTQKQIIFKASLPALGFNTYFFEKKRKYILYQ